MHCVAPLCCRSQQPHFVPTAPLSDLAITAPAHPAQQQRADLGHPAALFPAAAAHASKLDDSAMSYTFDQTPSQGDRSKLLSGVSMDSDGNSRLPSTGLMWSKSASMPQVGAVWVPERPALYGRHSGGATSTCSALMRLCRTVQQLIRFEKTATTPIEGHGAAFELGLLEAACHSVTCSRCGAAPNFIVWAPSGVQSSTMAHAAMRHAWAWHWRSCHDCQNTAMPEPVVLLHRH